PLGPIRHKSTGKTTGGKRSPAGTVAALPGVTPSARLTGVHVNLEMRTAMSEKSRKQQIEEMLVAEPTDPFLRYGLAMEYMSQGDDEGAVRCFRELFAVAPDYVPAYLQIGQALIR